MKNLLLILSALPFQHTAARRRLVTVCSISPILQSFNTQPPEGGCKAAGERAEEQEVSTHSRPKAAANLVKVIKRAIEFQHTAARRRLIVEEYGAAVLIGFNTQPPEGG